MFFSQPAAIFLLPLDAISPGPIAWRQQGSGIRPLPLTHHQLLLIVDLQEIRRIVELMNEHGLTQFDLTKKDFQLKLKKGSDVDELRGLLASLPASVAAPALPAPAALPAAPAAAPAVADGKEICSPMVGTFYQRPAPDAASFVEVGSTVSVGQTLCIIEAMKVMNEIKAEVSGTIIAIVANDQTPVQFGDVLFRIK
ncbi:MAG: acetyl-CoA carboxylase biotin carboxyl carrier protein [Verrucomicrobia bacterium]|nr:acetyl-CoA carboxylase biotin carboxyl carrier protein [Verrucomicrobiota bacterium]